MITSHNIKRVFIGNNCNRTSGLTPANLNKNLGEGEIVIMDKEGNILKTVVTTGDLADTINSVTKEIKEFRIVQGRGNGLLPVQSGLIPVKGIRRIHGKKFEQAVQRKAVLGYNGSTGSIDPLTNNSICVTVEHFGKESFDNSKPLVVTCGHKTGDTATQIEIADNIVEQLCADYAQYQVPVVKAYRLGSPAGTSMSTVAALKGSRVITYQSGDGSKTGYLKIDGYVYKIVSENTTSLTYTLDTPYQGDDNATATCTNITAFAVSDNVGIVIEGEVQPFKVGRGAYRFVNFNVFIKGFSTATTKTNLVGDSLAKPGSGRHEPVSVEEYYFQGEDKNMSSDVAYDADLRKHVIDNHGYSAIYIEYDEINDVATNSRAHQPCEIEIFIDRGTYANIAANAAGTALGTNVITGTGSAIVAGDSFMNGINALGAKAGVISKATAVNTVSNGGFSLAGAGQYNSGIDF